MVLSSISIKVIVILLVTVLIKSPKESKGKETAWFFIERIYLMKLLLLRWYLVAFEISKILRLDAILCVTSLKAKLLNTLSKLRVSIYKEKDKWIMQVVQNSDYCHSIHHSPTLISWDAIRLKGGFT